MDDLSEKISEVLSSPDALEVIQSIVASLGKKEEEGENHPPLGGDDIDLSKLLSIMPVLSSMSSTEDERSALLMALRPYLKEPRRQRVDEATRLLKVIKLIPALQEMGLFEGFHL